jgi:DNA-binding Lrp family transcriptional regulator
LTGTSWRERVKVHPAADLFPMMPNEELIALGKDIAEHGLRHHLIFYCDRVKKNRNDYPRPDEMILLDGRNRLVAMECAGISLFNDKTGAFEPDAAVDYEDPVKIIWRGIGADEDFDPYAYVISTNVHRRHLSIEDKEKIAADVLKARPERSNREVAKMVKLSHPKIAKIRRGLEEAGMVETVTTIVGSDGVKQPATKPARPPNPLKQSKEAWRRARREEQAARPISKAGSDYQAAQLAERQLVEVLSANPKHIAGMGLADRLRHARVCLAILNVTLDDLRDGVK